MPSGIGSWFKGWGKGGRLGPERSVESPGSGGREARQAPVGGLIQAEDLGNLPFVSEEDACIFSEWPFSYPYHKIISTW